MAGGLRRRESVASLPSIASFSLNIGQKKAWKELCRELHGNGITAAMIKAKEEEIFKLFQTTSASVLRSRGKLGEEVQDPKPNSQQRKRRNKIDWVPLDSVIVILLTPATRARYFVAELGVKRLLGMAGATTIDTRNSAGETALHIAASKG